MTSSPSAPKCANWSRGCTGTRADFDAPMDETSTPESPAFLEGQRAGACSRSTSTPRNRSATPPIQPRRRAAWATSKRQTRAAWRASRARACPRRRAQPPLGRDGAQRQGRQGPGRQRRQPIGWRRRPLRAVARRPPALLLLTGHAGASPMGGVAGPRRAPSVWPHSRRLRPRRRGRYHLRPRPRRCARRARLPTPGHHDYYRQPVDFRYTSRADSSNKAAASATLPAKRGLGSSRQGDSTRA